MAGGHLCERLLKARLLGAGAFITSRSVPYKRRRDKGTRTLIKMISNELARQRKVAKHPRRMKSQGSVSDEPLNDREAANRNSKPDDDEDIDSELELATVPDEELKDSGFLVVRGVAVGIEKSSLSVRQAR